MILSMTTIMPWIGVLVQEKIKTGSNDLSSYEYSILNENVTGRITQYILSVIRANRRLDNHIKVVF